jgi:hypothetical protein
VTDPKLIARPDARPAAAPEPTPEPKPLALPVVGVPRPEPQPSPEPLAPPVVSGVPRAGITYLFQDTLAAEEQGVPALIPTDPLGKNGFETTTVFGRSRRVYRFSGNAAPTDQQAGLTFDNSSGLLAVNNYSIEMVFLFLQKENQWRRIVDVEDRQSDNGFYVDPANRLAVYPCPGSGNPFTNAVFHHIVLTNAVAGTVNAYLDGTREFTGTTTVMNITNPRSLLHFFLDDYDYPKHWTNDFSDGKIALLRLYNEVLTDEQVSRLAGAARGISTPGRDRAPEKGSAAPDPGNLTGFQDLLGQTLYFRVTGSTTGPVWGTDIYTTDSNLATAAVHAGVLSPGATGVVRVRMVGGLSAYAASTRNGVTSAAWTAFPCAYTVSRMETSR